MSKQIAHALLEWYKKSSRPLPWRENRDPYRIWISEVMLQQTTVAAVIPYYEKFLRRFPTITKLASAQTDDVLEMWAGLGYYSRARNIHAAAKTIVAQNGFPKTHEELLNLPGFGPYISRAVSSIAFEEPVAAVDGNLIRVLSRLFGLQVIHWATPGKKQLQSVGDELMQWGKSSEINQALMDLGSDICAKQNPRCHFCPLAKMCVANQKSLQNSLPLVKARRPSEIWLWEPEINKKNGKIQLIENLELPFLKKQWLFPGPGRKIKKRPKKFTFKHVIMHYEIFVTPKTNKSRPGGRWIKINELQRVAPFSILRKAL